MAGPNINNVGQSGPGINNPPTPMISLGGGNIIIINFSRVLTDADNGATLVNNGASNYVLSVPVGLASSFGCSIAQNGSGTLALAVAGATVTNRNSYTKTAGAGAIMALVAVGTDAYISSGDGQA